MLGQYAKKLSNMTQIHFPCDSCEIPHVYIFILPSKDIQKSDALYMKSAILFAPSQNHGTYSKRPLSEAPLCDQAYYFGALAARH